MSTVDYILFLAGAQGLMLALALGLSGINKRPANIHLGILIMVCALELLNAWAIGQNYHDQPRAIPFWILGSYLWIPPALGIYLAYLLVPGFRFTRTLAVGYLPAVTEILAEGIVYVRFRVSGQASPLSGNLAWMIFTEILPVVATLLVLALGFHWYRQQRAASGPRPLPARPLRKPLAILVIFSVLSLLWLGESIFQLPFFPATLFLLCMLLFVLGYLVYFRPDFYDSKEVAARTIATTDPAEATQALERVRRLLETEKAFLQPRLTLDMLATQAGAPARLVSALINQHYGTNFSQLINQYRVREVLEQLKDPANQHKTLLGIALDCGFNSKSSFNQVFKSVTGETPSAYLQKQKSAPIS